MWRGEVRRGRVGQAFDFGEPGVLDGATAKSLAAGRHGPRQVGQIVKTKPLRRSCLRILDQSLEPREPALQATGRLSSPVRSPGFLTGGLDSPLPNHAQGHSRPIERPLRTLTRRARSRAGRTGNDRFVSHRSFLCGDALPVAPQSTEQGPGHGAIPLRDGRPFSRSPDFVLNTKGRAFRRLTRAQGI
jgi:hypothetical protein